MVLADNSAFLEELGRLYEQNRKTGCGSVWVTLKRTFPALDGVRGLKRKRALQDEDKSQASVCLIRATNGRKKISTQASIYTALKEIQFSGALMGVVRLNADELRPAQRAPRKKVNPEAQPSDAACSQGNKRMRMHQKPSAGDEEQRATDSRKGNRGMEKREDCATENVGGCNVGIRPR
ncbi:signal recognition particle 14kd protein [Besnoitia besnoiti]|uniref:Signal recognition particle 14 kDa protein n=1 Tax=Besnoitia besnoiti TaxID=94643 RepID=A0A2A9M8D4_BESBE|nr:signal recognition particle 14kd protein [Besnoitia besnoiti]PFH33424.1 signal recognition particle 14kd protein [Besnoitia besnoiti]